eukprot:725977_1
MALNGAKKISPDQLNQLSRYHPNAQYERLSNWGSGSTAHNMFIPSDKFKDSMEKVFQAYRDKLHQDAHKHIRVFSRNNLFHCHAIKSDSGKPLLVFHGAEYIDGSLKGRQSA